MDVLGALSQLWVLAATLEAAGLVFLADVAAAGDAPRGSAPRFVLDVLSLPLGALVLAETVLLWHSLPVLALGISLVVGVVLVGRSLRDVPWTGCAALAVGGATGYFVDRGYPALPYYVVLGAAAVASVLVYAVLFVIEIPFRLAALVSVPRPVLVAAAFGSFVGAALVFV
jgi:hypothetical protein